ncbi:hypothetical protein ACH5RR_008918 [Cinchona calisaya]|uniref:MI domain-containing protein n=1 Tax=Cinchona calisaya TaxID=153742 RepID=A0ABD3ACU4_9GENT
MESPLENRLPSRHSEPDNSTDSQEEVNQYNLQEQLNSQFARTEISSNQGGGGGPSPAYIKAEVPPWSARKRRNLSDRDRVLKTAKGILNKMTWEKFVLLEHKLVCSGIKSVDILVGVTLLIYEKAVLEPIYCPMYATLCCDLKYKLPEFPSFDVPGGRAITFQRLLLNKCQETFEGDDKLREDEHKDEYMMLKLRSIGNIRLIGELCKQKMVTESIVHRIAQELLGKLDRKVCTAEQTVESICELFNTIGKQFDETSKSRRISDLYFDQLKDLATNLQLSSRLRFMILDVLDLRMNNWVPRREKLKPRTIIEIHLEAEKDLGLHPGATTSIRGGRGRGHGRGHGRITSTTVRGKNILVADKPLGRAVRFTRDELRRKTISLLEEYFSVRLLHEAEACVEEMKSPAYYNVIVTEAVSLGLEKYPPCVEQVAKLVEYLFKKTVFTRNDIAIGFERYAKMLDDLAIDLPKAPSNFGEIVGRLILCEALDFKVVNEILKKVTNDNYLKALLNSVLEVVSSSHSGMLVLYSQAPDVQACEALFQKE